MSFETVPVSAIACFAGMCACTMTAPLCVSYVNGHDVVVPCCSQGTDGRAGEAGYAPPICSVNMQCDEAESAEQVRDIKRAMNLSALPHAQNAASEAHPYSHACISASRAFLLKHLLMLWKRFCGLKVLKAQLA
jgi:hypothetical protein